MLTILLAWWDRLAKDATDDGRPLRGESKLDAPAPVPWCGSCSRYCSLLSEPLMLPIEDTPCLA